MQKAPAEGSDEDEWNRFVGKLAEQIAARSTRIGREVGRRELRRKAKLYATLASQRESHKSGRAAYFRQLSHAYNMALELASEKPKRSRAPRPAPILRYPIIEDDLTVRLHFIGSGSVQRERATEFSSYATFHEIQWDADIPVLSVASKPDRLELAARIMDALGLVDSGSTPGLPGRLISAGRPRPDTIQKMMDDNFATQKLLRDAGFIFRIVSEGSHGEIRYEPPSREISDPDPDYITIQRLTSERKYLEAMTAFKAKRGSTPIGPLTDEVLYLRWLMNQEPEPEDILWLKGEAPSDAIIAEEPALYRKYLKSAMSSGEFAEGLAKLQKDWPSYDAFEEKVHRALETDQLKRCHWPRGRLFVRHPDVVRYRARAWERLLNPVFRDAEDMLREAKGLPPVGERWFSEIRLLRVVQMLFPDAIHQWSPPWLGRQRVDIFVPSLNVAIEYQGEQHYRAVELYGGEEGLAATNDRDARKRRLCSDRGVALIEWRYDEPITIEAVRDRIKTTTLAI